MDESQSLNHLEVTRCYWKALEKIVSGEGIVIDGTALDIPHVVAVARNGCIPQLTSNRSVTDRMAASVDVLMSHLAEGRHVYGVNTGFGGSADSRTNDLFALQAALLQLTQAGVLAQADKDDLASTGSSLIASQAMPSAWVKAMMLVRCNVTARGHSAVSIPVIHSILALFRHRITPVVPLRGSVSASGDLMPLSYVAGAIEGSPDVFVRMESKPATLGVSTRVMTAKDALKSVGADIRTLGPKEGLGLVNGTSASAALASLVIYESHHLALLTQALSAMACEALLGTSESFHSFIAEVRPHAGQIESARNIFQLLQGSKLTQDTLGKENRQTSGLIQNRYAVRSASQWIGPQLEDLLLADRQIRTELNSSSDNPLVDTNTQAIYNGANFQGTSITSAMEKTRLSLQMFGKLLFSQATELIDPSLSNGLPTNLVADNPSLSFTMKGVDVSMASYMSELAYLANPVSSHVQAAEMHNQSVNSMAFVSARFTMQAVELLSLICACSLYVCCQALDLRAMHLSFLSELRLVLPSRTSSLFAHVLSEDELNALNTSLDGHVSSSWQASSRLDANDRFRVTVDASLPIILKALVAHGSSGAVIDNAALMDKWRSETVQTMKTIYESSTTAFFKKQHTADLLGVGSKTLYLAVRQQLGVPFHTGLVEHPTAKSSTINGRAKKSIGSWISIIYEALRDGRLHRALIDAFPGLQDSVKSRL
ncbi:Phenylalanine aminomutase (L-beta-phenylalanine forming) [Lachnellula arida]|uniref:Phenylalanine aminomutase (L-beta-phenylalanine forming) n=1 Tax=Lachnellula arida TaxID=1316785 RepID=A0A8T9AYS1_9HELO|nr:Phenylalanine aminomutase (L-beta-phenylalanine forming) [Lachnellula arida]